MLSSVEIRNFKNIRHQRIELEPLTVFVGPNASGKTSVLEAIHLAVQAVRDRNAKLISKLFSGEYHCDWLYSRGGTGDMSLTCSTKSGDFAIAMTPNGSFPPSRIELFGQLQNWTFRVTPEAPQVPLQAAGITEYLKLNSKKLADSAYTTRIPPQLESDGEGLASVLAFMALNDPDGFENLVDAIRTLIPSLRRIRFTRTPIYRMVKEDVRIGDDTLERQTKQAYQGDTILFDFSHGNNVAAHKVSDGTLMLLGLLTVLLGPSRPDILLLDDIEHGLHPLAQKTLLDVLNGIMGRFPNLQIIATAHSPYLLDGLKPEQIRLMTTESDGYAICGRLTEHPQFEKWKDEMAPGELWSLFGEQWVAEGGVAS